MNSLFTKKTSSVEEHYSIFITETEPHPWRTCCAIVTQHYVDPVYGKQIKTVAVIQGWSVDSADLRAEAEEIAALKPKAHIGTKRSRVFERGLKIYLEHGVTNPWSLVAVKKALEKYSSSNIERSRESTPKPTNQPIHYNDRSR